MIRAEGFKTPVNGVAVSSIGWVSLNPGSSPGSLHKRQPAHPPSRAWMGGGFLDFVCWFLRLQSCCSLFGILLLFRLCLLKFCAEYISDMEVMGLTTSSVALTPVEKAPIASPPPPIDDVLFYEEDGTANLSIFVVSECLSA